MNRLLRTAKSLDLKYCDSALLSVKVMSAMWRLAHVHVLKKSYLCSVEDDEQPAEQCFVEFTDKQI